MSRLERWYKSSFFVLKSDIFGMWFYSSPFQRCSPKSPSPNPPHSRAVELLETGAEGLSTNKWLPKHFKEIPPGGFNISPTKGTFENDVPFPQVGYVSSLEGIHFKDSWKKNLIHIFTIFEYIIHIQIQMSNQFGDDPIPVVCRYS